MNAVTVNIRFCFGRKHPWRCQWHVMENGKRRSLTKYFDTEPEAQEFKRITEAESVVRAAQPSQITKEDRWIQLEQLALARGVSVEALLAPAVLSPTVAANKKSEDAATALELWQLDAKRRKLRPDTLHNTTYSVSAFLKTSGEIKVRDITAIDVLKWVLTYQGEPSRWAHRKNILSWLRWCAASPREWCEDDWKKVTWAKAVEDEEDVRFYTLTQAQAIMRVAPARLRPALAIGFLAGVRPGEIERMKVKDVRGQILYGIDFDKKEINIAADWSKVRKSRRLYDLPESLWLWLEPLRSPSWGLKDPDEQAMSGKKRGGRPSTRVGRVQPMNERNARKLWGSILSAAKIDDNIPDGLRHTFATHGYQRGLEWLIDMLGHQGMRMLKKHYQGKVSAAEGASFFANLKPGAQ